MKESNAVPSARLPPLDFTADTRSRRATCTIISDGLLTLGVADANAVYPNASLEVWLVPPPRDRAGQRGRAFDIPRGEQQHRVPIVEIQRVYPSLIFISFLSFFFIFAFPRLPINNNMNKGEPEHLLRRIPPAVPPSQVWAIVLLHNCDIVLLCHCVSLQSPCTLWSPRQPEAGRASVAGQ